MRIDTKETFLIKRQNIMEEQATYNRKHKYDVVIGIDPDVERSGQGFGSISQTHIIPFDKFDPNNIEESLKHNIVKP